MPLHGSPQPGTSVRFSKAVIVCLVLLTLSASAAMVVGMYWNTVAAEAAAAHAASHARIQSVTDRGVQYVSKATGASASFQRQIHGKVESLMHEMRKWVDKKGVAVIGGVQAMMRAYMSENSAEALARLHLLAQEHTKSHVPAYDLAWGLLQLALEQEVAQDVVVDRFAGTVLTDVGVRPLIATSGGYGRGLIRNISRASVLANCAYGAPFIFGYLGEGSIDEAATTVATVAEHQNVAASDDTTFRRAIRTHCGLTDAAILHAHWEADEWQRENASSVKLKPPAHFVALDHEYQAVVLAIRGSISMHDLLTDVLAGDVSMQLGRAHAGIYATAEWFATNGNLQKILRHALLEHSSYRFVIVGHSLGAGISSTLALLWYRRHTFVDTGRVPHAFAIAPPAALDLDADNDALAQRLVTSVVLEDDVVPRLSLRSVDELVDKIEQRVEERDHLQPPTGSDGRLRGSQGKTQSEEATSPVPGSPQTTPVVPGEVVQEGKTAQLRPAGRIVRIHLCNKQFSLAPMSECDMVGLSMFCVTPKEHADRLYSNRCHHVLAQGRAYDLQSLILTSSMFINHMPDRYEEALSLKHYWFQGDMILPPTTLP